MKPKSKMGRPSLGLDAKQVLLSLRVSAREIKALRARAKAKGLTLSKYVMLPHRQGWKG